MRAVRYLRGNDDGLVVYRGRRCFIVMNKYPYNIGHVMIVPNRHVPSITDLGTDELSECGVLLMAIIKALARSSVLVMEISTWA